MERRFNVGKIRPICKGVGSAAPTYWHYLTPSGFGAIMIHWSGRCPDPEDMRPPWGRQSSGENHHAYHVKPGKLGGGVPTSRPTTHLGDWTGNHLNLDIGLGESSRASCETWETRGRRTDIKTYDSSWGLDGKPFELPRRGSGPTSRPTTHLGDRAGNHLNLDIGLGESSRASCENWETRGRRTDIKTHDSSRGLDGKPFELPRRGSGPTSRPTTHLGDWTGNHLNFPEGEVIQEPGV